MISIRWRLTTSLCVAVALLFSIAGFGVFWAMKDVLLGNFDETLTAKSRALITASEIDGGDFEIDLTVQDFAGFGRGGDDYFEILRTDGSLFLRSPSMWGEEERSSGFFEIKQPMDGMERIGEIVLGDGRNARYYVQRIYPKDDKKNRFQDLYLVVASPTLRMEAQLRVLGTILWIVGAILLLLMVPVIRFSLRSGLRELDRLTSEILEIRSNELHRRVNEPRLPAELRPVGLALNGWLERLENSFDRERRFTSHAAHELRTPLAELQAIAELGALDATGEDVEHYADIAMVICELGELLDSLAMLARADSGGQSILWEKIGLEESVMVEISRLEEVAEKRGVLFQVEIAAIHIMMDRVLWQTVLRNLFQNAVTYSPRGSTIFVIASRKGVSVNNPAPNLNEEDLNYLFERFWRKDVSRTGYRHSGLGLAIVRACCSMLGGKCQASLDPTGNLEMVVELDVKMDGDLD